MCVSSAAWSVLAPQAVLTTLRKPLKPVFKPTKKSQSQSLISTRDSVWLRKSMALVIRSRSSESPVRLSCHASLGLLAHQNPAGTISQTLFPTASTAWHSNSTNSSKTRTSANVTMRQLFSPWSRPLLLSTSQISYSLASQRPNTRPATLLQTLWRQLTFSQSTWPLTNANWDNKNPQ